MIKLTDLLIEGVRDPGIFKGIFLAGGPGSGKTYVAQKLFGIPDKVNVSKYGLKMVNQDTELEMFLKKYFGTVDIDDMPDELFKQLTDPTSDDYSGMRTRTKELSRTRLQNYLKGRLGVIIDGTGHKFKSVKDDKTMLEEMGYDTYMVFVNTSLEVAQERNKQRERILPDALLQKSWTDVQNNLGKFQNLFGGNFRIVDNTVYKPITQQVQKAVNKFIRKPVYNKIGVKWIQQARVLKNLKLIKK